MKSSTTAVLAALFLSVCGFTSAHAGKIDPMSSSALVEARPDVVAFINSAYTSPSQRAAAIQYGSALVYAITKPKREAGLQHSVGYLSSRSQVCLSWRFGADPQASADVRSKVREQILNTEARRAAYRAFYAAHDGVISHRVERGACNVA